MTTNNTYSNMYGKWVREGRAATGAPDIVPQNCKQQAAVVDTTSKRLGPPPFWRLSLFEDGAMWAQHSDKLTSISHRTNGNVYEGNKLIMDSRKRADDIGRSDMSYGVQLLLDPASFMAAINSGEQLALEQYSPPKQKAPKVASKHTPAAVHFAAELAGDVFAVSAYKLYQYLHPGHDYRTWWGNRVAKLKLAEPMDYRIQKAGRATCEWLTKETAVRILRLVRKSHPYVREVLDLFDTPLAAQPEAAPPPQTADAPETTTGDATDELALDEQIIHLLNQRRVRQRVRDGKINANDLLVSLGQSIEMDLNYVLDIDVSEENGTRWVSGPAAIIVTASFGGEGLEDVVSRWVTDWKRSAINAHREQEMRIADVLYPCDGKPPIETPADTTPDCLVEASPAEVLDSLRADADTGFKKLREVFDTMCLAQEELITQLERQREQPQPQVEQLDATSILVAKDAEIEELRRIKNAEIAELENHVSLLKAKVEGPTFSITLTEFACLNMTMLGMTRPVLFRYLRDSGILTSRQATNRYKFNVFVDKHNRKELVQYVNYEVPTPKYQAPENRDKEKAVVVGHAKVVMPTPKLTYTRRDATGTAVHGGGVEWLFDIIWKDPLAELYRLAASNGGIDGKWKRLYGCRVLRAKTASALEEKERQFQPLPPGASEDEKKAAADEAEKAKDVMYSIIRLFDSGEESETRFTVCRRIPDRFTYGTGPTVSAALERLLEATPANARRAKIIVNEYDV